MADDSATDALPGGEKTDPATVFAALAEIIYQGSDADEMYAAICVAATLIVPGCDHASLLVRQRRSAMSPSAPATGSRSAIDDFERRAGDGPCIDAIEEETPQIETDLTTPSQWPQLAAIASSPRPRCAGRWGFGSWSISAKARALNLFSGHRNLFDTESAGRAAVLASFTSVAINADRQGRRCHHPATRAAQQPRDRQGRRHADDAARHIRGRSVRTCCAATRKTLNIKLADVARAIIERRGKLLSDDARTPRSVAGDSAGYSGSRSSGFSTSSMLTSLKVTTRTCLTNRAGRYMSHTQASESLSSK